MKRAITFSRKPEFAEEYSKAEGFEYAGKTNQDMQQLQEFLRQQVTCLESIMQKVTNHVCKK